MQVRMQLHGPHAEISARAAVEASSAMLDLLQAGDDNQWTLADAAVGSFTVVLAPPADERAGQSEERARVVLSGLDHLRRQASIPAGFTPHDVKLARRLARVSGRRGVESLTVSDGTSGAEEVCLDATVAGNADDAVRPRRDSLGEAVGVLHRINLRRRRTAGLVDAATGAPVEIVFGAELQDDLVRLVGQRVSVLGRLQRNAAGQKLRLRAWSVQPAERHPPVPVAQLVGILGEGWTGGASSVDFVRAQRRG